MTIYQHQIQPDDVVLVEVEGLDVLLDDDEEVYLYLSSTLPPEVDVPTDAHAAYYALVYYAERGEEEGISPTHREIANAAGFVGVGSSVRLRDALTALEEAKVIDVDVLSARLGHTFTTITMLGPEWRKSEPVGPPDGDRTGV